MKEINLKDHTILIVEDSSTQALLLKNNLEKFGITCQIAKDGVDGIEMLDHFSPELIICDIEMPRMNGYEFCKKMKSTDKFKNIPVILLTNLKEAIDVIKGMECGADSFLTKPCENQLLLSTIENAINSASLQNKYPKEKLEFFFADQTHTIEVNPVQIIELLLSTYSSAIQKNLELEEAYHKLNKLYAELEVNNQKLQDLNKQKNQLLGMAAHDLKNPLAVITGFSNFLLNLSSEKMNYEKTHQMFERINDSSSFMLRVIDDLLDFSSIESGILSLHLEDVNLEELIKKDLLFFESLAQKKDIKIEFKCTESIPEVQCDTNKIAQVLNNLVSNAIKFSYPKGIVTVEMSQSNDQVIISVKDSGVGMTQETIEGLFLPFTKIHSQGTAGEKGFGLGLAIVNKIIIAHHGKIWVESKIGSGTTFFISIPFKQAVEEKSNSKPSSLAKIK